MRARQIRRVVNNLKVNEELPKSGRESPDSGSNQLLQHTGPDVSGVGRHSLVVIDNQDGLAI